MPRLPDASALGEPPSARSGRPIATYDATAVGRGVADLGAGIAKLGASLDGLSDGWAKTRALDAEARFQQFKWEEAKAYDEAARNVPPGGAADFAKTYVAGYKERGKAFLASVPEADKPAIAGKLFSYEQGIFTDAVGFERKEQARFANQVLDDAVGRVFLPKVATIAAMPADDPRKAALLKEAEAEALAMVDKNPALTLIEKDEKKRAIRATVQGAFAAALPPDERRTLDPSYEDAAGGLTLPSYWTGELAPYTVERVAGVNTNLLKVVTRAAEIAAAQGVQFVVGDMGGNRSQAEQDALYAKGRTAPGVIVTKTRNSRHIGGGAIDLWPLVNGKPLVSGNPSDAPGSAYDVIDKAMRQASAELGIPVDPGPAWDRPHWQLKRGAGGRVYDPFGVAASKEGFFKKLIASESGGKATVVNRLGYAGLYQFGVPRLVELGVYDPQGENLAGWARRGARGKWTGEFNIPGFPDVRKLPDFLRNPAAQEAVFKLHLAKMDAEIKANGLDRFVGQTIAGVPITRDGLYAMIHLGGPAGTRRMLESGGKTNPADENGTSLLDYARMAADGAPVSAGNGGWGRVLDAIPYDDRIKLAAGAEAEIVRIEAEADKQVGAFRQVVEKEGYDLLRDDAMTEEWLDAHRDDIGVSAYRAFSLDPSPAAVKVDPKEYLALLDQVESDPEGALADIREAYAEGRVPRDVFSKITSLAEDALAGDGGKPKSYIGQIRSYVNSSLQPGADASQREFSRYLDTRFIFDDWIREHPDATRQELRAFADDLIANQRRYIAAEQFKTLPVPRFADVPNRWLLNQEALDAAKAKTAEALTAGSITEADAKEQAKLLQQWFEVIRDFGGQPMPAR